MGIKEVNSLREVLGSKGVQIIVGSEDFVFSSGPSLRIVGNSALVVFILKVIRENTQIVPFCFRIGCKIYPIRLLKNSYLKDYRLVLLNVLLENSLKISKILIVSRIYLLRVQSSKKI